MIYKAYYDASGSQADPADKPNKTLVVMGVVATEKKWGRFECDWKALLSDAGLDYFRTAEFVRGEGPYKLWESKHRNAFIGRAVRALKLHVNKTFGCAVQLAAYAAVDADYPLSEIYGGGHPRSGAYAFCAGLCHARVEGWMRQKKQGLQVSHVFEHGDVGQGALIDQLRLRQNLLGGHSFLPKQDPVSGDYVRQFEAADFMAWNWRNGYREFFGEEGHTPGPMLSTIAHHLPLTEGCFHEDGLRGYCDQLHKRGVLPKREDVIKYSRDGTVHIRAWSPDESA